MCMETPCEHIKKLIGDQMDAFVRQWNTEGIIYENDFCISSVTIENEWKAVLQVLEEAGCEVSEEMTATTAAKVEDGGWMYAGFNSSRYTFTEAEQMIQRKFRRKNL